MPTTTKDPRVRRENPLSRVRDARARHACASTMAAASADRVRNGIRRREGRETTADEWSNAYLRRYKNLLGLPQDAGPRNLRVTLPTPARGRGGKR